MRRAVTTGAIVVLAGVALLGPRLVGDDGGAKRKPGRDSAIELRTTSRVPSVIAGEHAQRVQSRQPGPAVPLRAQRVFARERRTTLRPLLGSATVRVVEVGRLDSAGRAVGVTLLLEVAPVQRGVSATVPVYAANSRGRARRQVIDARIDVLRDLLVDIDVRRGKLLAVEPGPLSVTGSWEAPEPPGVEDED